MMFLLSVLLLLVVPFFECSSFDIVETTIDEIRKALSEKTLTCEQLIQLHIDRIYKYERKLNGIISFNPEALNIAREYDKKGPSGDLWCIPTILKDNINYPTLATTGGSIALGNSYPNRISPVAEALVKAGAIIIAKGSMAEFAADGMNTKTLIGGQCLNLYTPDRSPYGSSGGIGASITGSFAVIGIGTDTCGSVVNPSSAASLVGLRPDRHHVNIDGIIPLNFAQDVYGVMTRSSKDASYVWSVLRTLSPPNKKLHQKMKKQEKKVPTKTILWMSDFLSETNFSKPDQSVISICQSFLSDLSPSFQITSKPIYFKIEQKLMPYFPAATKCSTDLFKYYLSKYLNSTDVNTPFKSLQQLYDSNIYDQSLKHFFNGSLEAPDPHKDPACDKFTELRNLMRKMILDELEGSNSDILLYPSCNQNPPLLKNLPSSKKKKNANSHSLLFSNTGRGSDQLEGMMCSCLVSAWSGLPSISVPIGYTKDVGAAYGIIALAENEEKLLEFAQQVQDMFHFRKTPPMPSLD